MKSTSNNTESLWSAFFALLVILISTVILTLGYLLISDINTNQSAYPKYTTEQLAEMTKKRERQRSVERSENWDLVENGIHLKSGLNDDPNLKIIIGACTSCHSAKLITQNRATRQGWKNMIVWMQETQGLVDLGNQESVILDYLSKHYAPEEVGRRKNLDMEAIEWYVLDLTENG